MILSFNKEFTRQFGYTEADTASFFLWELLYSKKELIHELLQGRHSSEGNLFFHHSGEISLVDFNSYPIQLRGSSYVIVEIISPEY